MFGPPWARPSTSAPRPSPWWTAWRPARTTCSGRGSSWSSCGWPAKKAAFVVSRLSLVVRADAGSRGDRAVPTTTHHKRQTTNGSREKGHGAGRHGDPRAIRRVGSADGAPAGALPGGVGARDGAPAGAAGGAGRGPGAGVVALGGGPRGRHVGDGRGCGALPGGHAAGSGGLRAGRGAGAGARERAGGLREFRGAGGPGPAGRLGPGRAPVQGGGVVPPHGQKAAGVLQEGAGGAGGLA